MNTTARFVEGHFYHIYNRTNNKEKLFLSKENRRYFLMRYSAYLKPFVSTHAYALLSNHFHFSIQIKSCKEIAKQINKISERNQTKAMKQLILRLTTPDGDNAISTLTSIEIHINNLIVHQFQSFFNSYTKSFNIWNRRKGNLFQRKFKRSNYEPTKRFQYLIYYIHHNARKHGLVSDFKDYAYQSYYEIVEQESVIVDTADVISRFEGKKAFINFHQIELLKDRFLEFKLDEDEQGL